MSIKTHLQALLIISLIALLPAHIYAQKKGRVYGTVFDKESGETLLGANVLITGTTRGVATDLDGNYNLTGLEPGTYSITATYISYLPTTITDVEIVDGGEIRLDFQMEMEGIGLEEITVSAEVVKTSDAAMLSLQKKAVGFQDGISSEMISRTGSGDAASAMQKVVGASVVGGKYVYVRGLGDRYSSTHLNGSELPSADPDKKSFQMDLIPSNLIQNIVTIKTFTPDKPGNFSGGLVDIGTKEFPDKLTFQFSASSAYNTQVTGGTGLGSERSGTDLIGFDNGQRNLPSTVGEVGTVPLQSDALFTNVDGHSENAALLNQVSNSFNSEMVANDFTIPFNSSVSVSLGNRFELFNKTFGYTIGVNHNRSFSSYDNGVNGIWQLIGNVDENTQLTALNNMNDRRTSENVDVGGLVSFSFKPNNSSKVTMTAVRTQSGSNVGRFLSGYREEPAQGGFDSYNSNVIEYTERSLASIQLRGKHVAESSGVTFEWNAMTAQNSQEQPDIRYFEYGYNSSNEVYSISRALFQRPSRFYRDLTEDNISANADLTIPVTLPTGIMKIKTGGSYLSGSRDFNERRFSYQQDQVSLNDNPGDFDSFFSNVGVVDTVAGTWLRYSNYIEERTNLNNFYNGERLITAAYGMVEIPVAENLKFIGGARYETTGIKTLIESNPEANGEISTQDLLPSATLIFSATEKMNFRAAYTHTLARPQYRELAPFTSFDAYGGFIISGNSQLQRTLIRNMDFRWEYYTSPGELFALSMFYKNMDNPIEKVFDVQRVRALTWQNVPTAEVYGIEFEARKNLGFLGESFTNFFVASNLTFVRSIVDIPETEMLVIETSDPGAASTRQLNGQSPFIFNFDISYNNPKNGLTVDVNTNTFGDRLAGVTLGANPDVIERSYTSLNMIVTKRISDQLSGKVSMRNLLDPDIVTSSELNGQEYIYTSFKLGRTISVGVSYSF